MYRVKENLNNFLDHVKINDTIKYVEKIEVGKVSVEETFQIWKHFLGKPSVTDCNSKYLKVIERTEIGVIL